MQVKQANQSPFRFLSPEQLDELNRASIHILETTGVTIESEEAIGLLSDAGANVSNNKRVKIPGDIVEQALKTTPKEITFYTRDGKPYLHLEWERRETL